VILTKNKMPRMKISLDDLKNLPVLLQTKSRQEIATEWGVALSSIDYWIRQFRNKGAEMPNKKVGKAIDKIEIKYDTSIENKSGEPTQDSVQSIG